MKIELLKGNIAEIEADAVVNAAGTSLSMGGGVAGALKRKGGKEIETEALKSAPAKLGEVVVTKAGKLKAKYVFHAAAQPHHGSFKATTQSVRIATRNALKKAEELGCKSIAIPAIGCGIAGLEIEKGAKAILTEIRLFEEKAKSIEKLKIVLFSEKDLLAFKKELYGIVPSEKKCIEILRENRVPENIVRHSKKVAEFAVELAQKIDAKGEKIDIALVRAGALLHDIDKLETLESSKKHGIEGWKKLRKKGFYGVAEIAKKHLIEKVGELSTLEEKIVYYADKRVLGEKIVPLNERLEYIKQKYGSKNQKLMEKIVESEKAALLLEKNLLEMINK
ncbi:MAG: macro domain-containing protein [Candidatus Diapherotrites archaeon]